MQEREPDNFICYSRGDSEFAIKLAKDLRGQDISVWIDQLDVKPSARWDRAVEQALRDCKLVIVILSPESVDSENVMDEINYALDEGKQILPVLYLECNVPFRIRRFQRIDFTGEYDEGFGSLLSTLNPVYSSVETKEEVEQSYSSETTEKIASDNDGLMLDSGALKAMRAGASLLPIGILGVIGHFKSGSIVSLYDDGNQLVATGEVRYGSKDILKIKGRHSDEINTILGRYFGDSVILNTSLDWLETDTKHIFRNGLFVDSGALEAMRAGASLLPIGILGVIGHFNSGSIVSLYDDKNQLVASGEVRYGSKDILKIKGRHSSEINTILGRYFGDSVILNTSVIWSLK